MRRSVRRLFTLACLVVGSFGVSAQTDEDALPQRPGNATAPRPAPSIAFGADDVVFDHASGTMTCGGRNAAGCRLSVEEGQLVTLQVIRSVPGILTANVRKIDRAPDVLDSSIFQKLTKGIPGSTTGEERVAVCSQCTAPFGCYREIRDALQEVQDSILHDLTRYELAICELRSSADNLERGVNVNRNDATALQQAFYAALTPQEQAFVGEAEAFREFWTKLVALLKAAPAQLSAIEPYGVEYTDRDFDLELTFTSNHPELIKAPEGSRQVQVRLRNGWGISTSTALMASGLANDEYTTSTFTATVDGAPVEKRRAVREDRDLLAPEIAFLVNLFPKAPSSLGRSVLSVGVGMGEESGGRLYATWGYRFGQAGAWHVGAALGRVKRLSKNVNVEDLGETDPNASRRDVMRASFTLGISWRLGD